MSEPFENEQDTQKKQPKKKKPRKTRQQSAKTKRKDEEQEKNQEGKIKTVEPKREEHVEVPEEIDEQNEQEDEWIDVQKIKSQHCITSMEKEIKNNDSSDNRRNDMLLDKPLHQNENEAREIKRIKGWYSPFSTGLDLDILPKFTMDPLCQYKIKFTPPSPPLIPNLLEQNQHQPHSSPKQSIIELLENHPFISTNHSHHHQHTLGPIGGNKPKSVLK